MQKRSKIYEKTCCFFKLHCFNGFLCSSLYIEAKTYYWIRRNRFKYPPPPLNVDVDVADLQKAFEAITSAGDTKGWGDKESGWQESDKLLTTADSLKDKYLIGILKKDANDDNVVVLGISEDGDVYLGSKLSSDQNAVSNAIVAAGNSNNWDPRKLVYDIGNPPNYNSTPRTVRISWSGRAGDPPPSGSKLAFAEFKGYDKYKEGVLSGDNATFSVLHQSDYKVYFVKTNILDEKGLTFEKVKEKKENSLNFVYETGKTSDRKAWMWNHGDKIYECKTARVLNPASIRFAYGDNDFSYPYKPDSSIIVKKGDKALDLSSGTLPAQENIFDNSEPNGKTIIARSQKQLRGEAADWSDYTGDYVMFLTTVVGYNVRVRPYTGVDIVGLKDYEIQEVIIEFDSSSFGDATKDGWTAVSDIPSRDGKIATPEIGSANGPNTHKIPFLLINPK